MRWPIRNQILLPFIVIQTVTIFAVAASSAWVAVRQAEQELGQRLENVLATLESATYPLTQHILDQLNQLSGAEFVVYNKLGTLEAANLKGFEAHELDAIDTRFEVFAEHLINQNAIVDIGGKRYFAGFVKPQLGNNEETVFVLFPESIWLFERTQAMLPPLMIGVVCLCLTVLASIGIARHVAQQIQTVQQHVSRIAAGDFTPVPSTKINDELRDLATGVNRMAQMLDHLMHTIRETERSAMLTQLVGGLAHQLRNALTGARTSIQLHQRHCSNSHDEAIEVALRQLRLTEEQIKALLRLARGEQSEAQPAEIVTVLDETAALAKPICTHHKINLSYQRDDCAAQVADADALRGALLNLLMNAIEAAGPVGTVELKATLEKESGMVIDVADNGPGVPDHIAEDIFTPFVTTKTAGVGLGLALAQRAAEDCGGTLSYQRERGRSIFRFTIPVRNSAIFVAQTSTQV